MDYPEEAQSPPAETSPPRRRRRRKPPVSEEVQAFTAHAEEPAQPVAKQAAEAIPGFSEAPQTPEAPADSVEVAVGYPEQPAGAVAAAVEPEPQAENRREPMTIAVNSSQPVNLSLQFAVNCDRPVNISINSNPPDQSETLPFAYGLPSQPLPPLTAGLRREMVLKEPNAVVRVLNYEMRIIKGFDFYIQYKDIFVRRIYHFESPRPDPLIIDGGSNIGMSILYFKHVYPCAQVIGFEPSPILFRVLRENMEGNGLSAVTLINAGLGARAGTVSFDPADHNVGGRFAEQDKGASTTVAVKPLSEFLGKPVDFLKLNIEGQELAVLQEVEASGKMGNLRELVLEYHGLPKEKPQLGPILDLLDRQGFHYLVHDFDPETNSWTKPPFHLTAETSWWCLVYAKRLGGAVG
jgi:FkbM family methyltransferase